MRVHGMDDLDNGQKHPQMVNRYVENILIYCGEHSSAAESYTSVTLLHCCKCV